MDVFQEIRERLKSTPRLCAEWHDDSVTLRHIVKERFFFPYLQYKDHNGCRHELEERFSVTLRQDEDNDFLVYAGDDLEVGDALGLWIISSAREALEKLFLLLSDNCRARIEYECGCGVLCRLFIESRTKTGWKSESEVLFIKSRYQDTERKDSGCLYERINNKTQLIRAMMDILLDKAWFSSTEKDHIIKILRDLGTSEVWIEKASIGEIGSGIAFLSQFIGSKFMKASAWIGGIALVVLIIGLIESVTIFLFRFESGLGFIRHLSGLPFAMAHIVLVSIVAAYCFHELTIDFRRNDIGPLTHKIGWLVIGITFFPIGLPIFMLYRLVNAYLEHRTVIKLKGDGIGRAVYKAKDLLGYTSLGRLWIPTTLFGVFGNFYWCYL